MLNTIKRWWRLYQPLKNKPEGLTKDMLEKALEYWSTVEYHNNLYSGLCRYFDKVEGIDSMTFGRFLVANNYIEDVESFYAVIYELEPRVELLKELIARWDL